MKKILLSVLAVLCCCSLFADVEEIENKNVTKVSGGQSYTFYKAYSHWSIAASGGFNFLVCERIAPTAGKIVNYKNNFLGQFNAEVEYSINPSWGVALNYAYAPIAKRAIFMHKSTYDVNPQFDGQGHQVYAMVNVNLLNIFRRYRGHADWGWYLGVGGGAYFFNTSKAMFDMTDGKKLPMNVTAMVPVETKAEYTPIPSLGIFVKAGLDFYLSDKVNVCSNGQLCDWNLYGGIGLRWNIGATRKPSVRTIDMSTYEAICQRPSVDDDTQSQQGSATEDKLAELQRQIDQLELRVANMEYAAGNASSTDAASTVPASGLNDRVLAVEKKADANAADIRDLKIDVNNIRELAMRSNATDENTIYFDNNSSSISKHYMIVLARIAKMMILDTSLQLDVSSYCSKSGDVELNKLLGEQRIDAVRYVLVNRYRIDPNRVHAHYNGQVDDAFDDMNRRCDLTFK